jgi:hypothetical protein
MIEDVERTPDRDNKTRLGILNTTGCRDTPDVSNMSGSGHKCTQHCRDRPRNHMTDKHVKILQQNILALLKEARKTLHLRLNRIYLLTNMGSENPKELLIVETER